MAPVFWEGAPFTTAHEIEAQARIARDLAERLAEEERRILHVGVSRARDLLYVTAPEELLGRGRGPSRFQSLLEPLMEVRDLRRDPS